VSEKLERLINLVAALRAAGRPLTRDELQERVPGYPDGDDAARRAFERDKDALRNMGIPITVEPSERDNPEAPEGYRIKAEQYELPDPGLDADELAALHLAVSAVRVEGGDATAAIWKLGGAASNGQAGGPDVALAGSEHLPLLFAAVSERRPITFSYKGEQRTVDPWRLAFRGGRWYLTGRDHSRDDERQFRLDRLTQPQPAGDAGAFERPADVAGTPPPPWAMGEEDAAVARVLVDPDQAVWAEGFFGPRAVAERRADGSIVFELTVTNRDAFRSMVLGFLDHAEVLAPPELRAELVGWLRSLATA
jgi:proteasome accessory factor B